MHSNEILVIVKIEKNLEAREAGMQFPKTILITGATSGLGKALAYAYAGNDTTLVLTGRDKERLKEVEENCRKSGSTVITEALDITDKGGMSIWMKSIFRMTPIDLVIANAGISGGTAGGAESEEQVRRILDVNINGVMNTILPIVPLMQERKEGQIAIISSLSALRGLPSAPAYSSSKAMVKAFGEGLRGILNKDNIEVSVICPGFIQTPMTDINDFPMPMLMKAEKAAKKIRNKLRNNPALIAFPWPLYFFIKSTTVLPAPIVDFLYRILPGKSG